MELRTLIARLEKDHSESIATYSELANRFETDEDYEESFDDTLTRKYEEGFSDALFMVLNVLKAETATTCKMCEKPWRFVTTQGEWCEDHLPEWAKFMKNKD